MKTETDRFFMRECRGKRLWHVSGFSDGIYPFVNTIGTLFIGELLSKLQYLLHNLPVRMIGNGGGYVYALSAQPTKQPRTLPV